MTLSSLNKYQARLLAASLGLFLFSIYLFIYRGGFHSIDEVSMFAVTESLVKFGRLNTDQIAWTQWTTSQAEAQGFFGLDGHVYSKKGLALSLAQAPLYGLALILPGIGMLQTVSLLNALVTAATGLLVLMFVWRLGFPPATALTVALIFGVATIAAVYAKYLFSEPLTGFLLLLAAYMLLAYRQEGGLRHVALAGLAAGSAVLARANNLFLLPIFGLYLLWAATATFKRSPEARFSEKTGLLIPPTGAFLLALAAPGLLLLAYNALRSGNPFQTGYDLTLFSSNAFLGLYKLLFSPLRGLFIYSPILLLSLTGWWRLRRSHPAEAWLLAGLVTLTVLLFAFWSSGEGLSWGSRFLVPLIPFFTICLAPPVHAVLYPPPAKRMAYYVWRITFYTLLPLSLLIQILGVTINPWVFLARLQAEFGGEFFLENTAALYNFRYSQIVGQLQSWSVQHSDLAWWQPWGFDPLAFGLSLTLVLLSGWLLWSRITHPSLSITPHPPGEARVSTLRPTFHVSRFTFYALLLLSPYLLLWRYYQTDRQFGPPDDPYIQALERSGAQAGEPVITVAQAHYHVPMNRFKARAPLIGFAQQRWPLPETALPLLAQADTGPLIRLVTINFPPAAADNAVEQWLARHTFKASDEWLPGNVRLVLFSTGQALMARPIGLALGESIELVTTNLPERSHAGELLPVEFTWRMLQSPQADYHLFLQLLNREGALVAQHDAPPNGGYTPTSTWQPGEPQTSRHALVLPENLPPGDYRLIAGLVDPANGARLLTERGGDFVELGNITIIETE